MPFTNQSPLVPVVTANSYTQPVVKNGQYQNMSPQEWEYIQQVRRTGYDPNQIPQMQTQQISDPYLDFQNEFGKCSNAVQRSILQDENFKMAMSECDRQIQSMVETIVRPQVMQTTDGRVCFERLLSAFRNIRDKYSEEEVKTIELVVRFYEI